MTGKVDRQAEVMLRKAAQDETVILLPGVPDGPFGFHVQQAVEKLLKAILCQLQVEYPRTHDLAYLVGMVKGNGETLPDLVIQFSELESFAVVHRYDDISEIEILDRPAAIETVKVLREHIVARIAALSNIL